MPLQNWHFSHPDPPQLIHCIELVRPVPLHDMQLVELRPEPLQLEQTAAKAIIADAITASIIHPILLLLILIIFALLFYPNIIMPNSYLNPSLRHVGNHRFDFLFGSGRKAANQFLHSGGVSASDTVIDIIHEALA